MARFSIITNFRNGSFAVINVWLHTADEQPFRNFKKPPADIIIISCHWRAALLPSVTACLRVVSSFCELTTRTWHQICCTHRHPTPHTPHPPPTPPSRKTQNVRGWVHPGLSVHHKPPVAVITCLRWFYNHKLSVSYGSRERWASFLS